MVSSVARFARRLAAVALLAAIVPGDILAAPADNVAPAADGANAPAKPSEPREAAPAVMENPDWLRMPSRRQVAESYPERALRLEKDGRVIMQCVATETGGIKDCSVTSERPIGLGFADAALRMARYYQLRPKTPDGVSVAGTKVIVDIPFELR